MGGGTETGHFKDTSKRWQETEGRRRRRALSVNARTQRRAEDRLVRKLNEPRAAVPLRLARFIVPDLSRWKGRGRRLRGGGGGIWNFQP